MYRVVVLEAVDWGIYPEQVTEDTDWEIVQGSLVGFLLSEDDDKVVLAQQWFLDGGVRGAMVIPKVCITRRLEFIQAEEIAKGQP